MQRKLLGAGHPHVADSLKNLALVLRAQGRFAEAKSMLRDAVALRRKLPEDDHSSMTALRFDLARVLRDHQKLAAAEPPIRECLDIREKNALGDWQTFDAKGLLGELLLDQKKATEAEPLLHSGFEGMKQREETIPAPIKPRLREVFDCLLEHYEASGQPDKVAEWKQKLEESKPRSPETKSRPKSERR